MKGVKKSTDSTKELIKQLSESVGLSKPEPPELNKIDNSTGTLFCATLDQAPLSMLEEAKKHYESEASVMRIQAETALIPGSTDIFSRKSTFARLAAQALEKYIKESR